MSLKSNDDRHRTPSVTENAILNCIDRLWYRKKRVSSSDNIISDCFCQDQCISSMQKTYCEISQAVLNTAVELKFYRTQDQLDSILHLYDICK